MLAADVSLLQLTSSRGWKCGSWCQSEATSIKRGFRHLQDAGALQLSGNSWNSLQLCRNETRSWHCDFSAAVSQLALQEEEQLR